MAMLPHVRLFNPQGPDRVASIRVEPAWPANDRFMLLLSRGPSRTKLRQGALLGPFAETELKQRLEEQAEALRVEGFLPAGLEAMRTALKSGSAAEKAHAALRLGWRRERDAVEQLLGAFATAGFERTSILDALGWIGDPRAIPVARQESEKKLLSRRRSGVEALRNLADDEGLAAARERSRERLPEAVQTACEEPMATAEALAALPIKDRGLALDTLYELGTNAAVAAVRMALISIDVETPHVWRYVKSVLKRSILRLDAETFGLCAYRVERAARQTLGRQAELKSGLDGIVRKTSVFRRRTQHYVMRLTWRQLRTLARHRPDLYARSAAEVLVHYRPADSGAVSSLFGPFASCHLLHRILWGESSRFAEVRSSLAYRYRGKPSSAPNGIREETFPELWDAEPAAYVRLLAAAKLREVHDFALAGIRRAHPAAVEHASAADVVAFLSAPHEETVALGLAELQRRFDPAHPDLELLEALARDGRESVRALALRCIEESAPTWSRDPDTVLRLLAAKDPEVRECVARSGASALREAAEPHLQEIAARVASRLRAKEQEEGSHDAVATLALGALLPQLSTLFDFEELVVLVATGSTGARSVAGALIGRVPNAARSIGAARLAVLCGHDVASLRASARDLLLSSGLDELQADPTLLFTLLDSEWDDARAFAIALLRTRLAPLLGRDVALGFLDSERADVQDLGRDLLFRDLSAAPSEEVAAIVHRLAQHPHRSVQRVAVDLAVGRRETPLTPELVPLLRSALFDISPDRRLKRAVFEFLRASGSRDEASARMAMELLRDFVGTEGRHDFELALGAMAHIQLAQPAVAGPLVGGSPA